MSHITDERLTLHAIKSLVRNINCVSGKIMQLLQQPMHCWACTCQYNRTPHNKQLHKLFYSVLPQQL